MDGGIKEFFYTQGILGILALILMCVVIRLYVDRERERTTHQKELKAFEDRYITKAETWMEKYHDLAKSLNSVLESIVRRGRSDG